MHKIKFSKLGFEKIKNEYEKLLSERPLSVLDLKKAREMGDLSENGYYKSAKMKLSNTDWRLRKLSFDIKNAEVIENKTNEFIGIGNFVTLIKDGKEFIYNIVGDLEADPSNRKISLISPLGRALENKKLGEKVEILTPSGKIVYKIINIS